MYIQYINIPTIINVLESSFVNFIVLFKPLLKENYQIYEIVLCTVIHVGLTLKKVWDLSYFSVLRAASERREHSWVKTVFPLWLRSVLCDLFFSQLNNTHTLHWGTANNRLNSRPHECHSAGKCKKSAKCEWNFELTAPITKGWEIL